MPRKLPRLAAALLVAVLLAACSRSGANPSVVAGHRLPPADWSSFKSRPVKLEQPATPDAFAVDLRQHDLSGTDLSQTGRVLMEYAMFDTDTIWPAGLPAGYDPKQIMALGKDPGLGVYTLHQQGITGKGVRVAFLDQTLLWDHTEYKARVDRYFTVGDVAQQPEMHSAAVLSILAGKEIGVAPGVTVTHYAVDNTDGDKISWINLAGTINVILDQNAKLPQEQRIRAIGISLGISPQMPGYDQIRAAIARARKDGVFVITVSAGLDYPLQLKGLGRDPLADPNSVNSYRPGAFPANGFNAWNDSNDRALWVPMDSRSTAGPTGLEAYAFYRLGGMSWTVPYLEGVYALALQVKPDLTPDDFCQLARETGSYSEFTHEGKSYRLGPIINPPALIAKLQGK